MSKKYLYLNIDRLEQKGIVQLARVELKNPMSKSQIKRLSVHLDGKLMKFYGHGG